MVCEVDGPYNMYWYKDVVMPGKEPNCITKRIANYKKQCTLEIKDFSKEDEALYICQVTRPLVNWVATDEVRLTMKGNVTHVVA